MKISEFARICRISPRMLRHYDAIGLFKPAGIDEQTQYRLYHASQIPVLQRILVLKDLGFTLERILEIEQQNPDPQTLERLLLAQQPLIEQRILEEQDRLLRLRHYLAQIQQEPLMEFQIELKTLPSFVAASLENQDLVVQFEQGGQDISGLIEEFVRCLQPHMETVVLETGGLPHLILWHEDGQTEYPKPELLQPLEKMQQIEGLQVKTMPAVAQAVCLEFRGSYQDEGMIEAFRRLHEHIEANGYTILGATRQVFKPESIELQIPVQV